MFLLLFSTVIIRMAFPEKFHLADPKKKEPFV
jgi:hypothetical protein